MMDFDEVLQRWCDLCDKARTDPEQAKALRDVVLDSGIDHLATEGEGVERDIACLGVFYDMVQEIADGRADEATEALVMQALDRQHQRVLKQYILSKEQGTLGPLEEQP